MAMRDDPSSFDTCYKEFNTIRSLFVNPVMRPKTISILRINERLKQLMQEALKSLLETEFHSEASRVFLY